MARRIDLYIKVKGILEFEAGKKTKAQIAREVGVTRQAVLYWIRGKDSLLSQAQAYSTVAFEHMISSLEDGTGDDPFLKEPPAMPEAKQLDDSERSQLKNLRDENTFLKSKVLYLEKLMEKKKDTQPSPSPLRREQHQ